MTEGHGIGIVDMKHVPGITSSHRLIVHTETAREQLISTISGRVDKARPDPSVSVVRFPVVLFFVRGDRAGEGGEIAKTVRASFEYWSKDSGDHLDVIFPGWYWEGSPMQLSPSRIEFDMSAFIRYRDEFQSKSKWKYTGETDILLLNFDFDICERTGDFSFQEVIFLPVEAMIRDGLVGSLDGLMNGIVEIAKSSKRKSKESPVWILSDKLGYFRGRKAFWDAFKKMVLRDFASAVDKLHPFAVCDLSR
jgi:hypothetical protein